MGVVKFQFQDSIANLDTSSFYRKSIGKDDVMTKGVLALEVAARRVVEIVGLMIDGEPIGSQSYRPYNVSAAYSAWRAIEDATLYFRIASETSDDKEFVRRTEKFFDFAPFFFNQVVENPYLPDWKKDRSPAFRYAKAIRTGDKKTAVEATRIVAYAGVRFAELALTLAPDNDDLKKTLKYCDFIINVKHVEKQELSLSLCK